jgi:hypothetical protein
MVVDAVDANDIVEKRRRNLRLYRVHKRHIRTEFLAHASEGTLIKQFIFTSSARDVVLAPVLRGQRRIAG